MLGQPVAWVNNQFRQYTFDVSEIMASNDGTSGNNLTINFEAASAYGFNVSTRPDMEFFPEGVSVVSLINTICLLSIRCSFVIV